MFIYKESGRPLSFGGFTHTVIAGVRGRVMALVSYSAPRSPSVSPLFLSLPLSLISRGAHANTGEASVYRSHHLARSLLLYIDIYTHERTLALALSFSLSRALFSRAGRYLCAPGHMGPCRRELQISSISSHFACALGGASHFGSSR